MVEDIESNSQNNPNGKKSRLSELERGTLEILENNNNGLDRIYPVMSNSNSDQALHFESGNVVNSHQEEEYEGIDDIIDADR